MAEDSRQYSSSKREIQPDDTIPASTFVYRVLGATIRSDEPLPRLEQLRERDDSDAERCIDITFRAAPSKVRNKGDERWSLLAPRTTDSADAKPPADEPAVRLWRFSDHGPYRYRYRDGAEFLVRGDGGQVWVVQPKDMSIEDVCSYLLGPVLALVLRLCGIVCLHASGVRIATHAVAFAGPAHAGKSTLAAAFALSGHSAISDDIVSLVPTSHGFTVCPDAPYLNLWPRAAELLLGDTEALPRWSETWEKRYLHTGTGPPRNATRLRAIYELALAPKGAPTRITALAGHEALVTLLRYARAATLVARDQRPGELDTLSDVVRSVSVRRLERAQNATPQTVRDAVIADLETLELTRS